MADSKMALETVLANRDREIRILSIGSGDGSQQAVIVNLGHLNLTTTFFDSRAEVLAKYPDTAPAHLETLTRASGPTLFKVDAKHLDTNADLADLGKYDVIFFMMPFDGMPVRNTGPGDDFFCPASISSNRALLQVRCGPSPPPPCVSLTLRRPSPPFHRNVCRLCQVSSRPAVRCRSSSRMHRFTFVTGTSPGSRTRIVSSS